MMYKKIIFLQIFLKVAVPVYAQVTRIDSVVRAEMEKQHITGLSLGVVKNGSIVLSKGYGFANLSDSTPVTEKTVFRLASLSKEMIAVNVMILVEQGKLSLTDRIDKYIPDVPRKWKEITIRDLLRHTSGLERESPAFDWSKIQPDSVVIEAAYRNRLLFAPGTGWSYSNLGYFVIAEIIRKVTGVSFEDYMNHFFEKCGLNNTATTSQKNVHSAKGYSYDQKFGEVSETTDLVSFRASSAVASCMSDMIRWDSMIGQSNVLSKDDWAKIWDDTVQQKELTDGSYCYYGYGWGVRMYHGHRLLEHSGSNPGFENEYWKFIDDGTSIIILTNGNKVSPGRIAKEIYSLLNYIIIN